MAVLQRAAWSVFWMVLDGGHPARRGLSIWIVWEFIFEIFFSPKISLRGRRKGFAIFGQRNRGVSMTRWLELENYLDLEIVALIRENKSFWILNVWQFMNRIRAKRKIGKIWWRSASTSLYARSHLGNVEWNESTKAWIRACVIHGCSRLACNFAHRQRIFPSLSNKSSWTPTPTPSLSFCQITFIDGGPRIKARLSVSITFINRKLKNNLRLCEQTSRSKVIFVYRPVKIIWWICSDDRIRRKRLIERLTDEL